MRQIEETKRLIAEYRNANEVIVGIQDEVYSRCGLMNRTTVAAADIPCIPTAHRTSPTSRHALRQNPRLEFDPK